jgi:hypothetical protein
MASLYEIIVDEFNCKKCTLLTTKKEHDELLKISIKCNYKLRYIASCGHEHTVFYNVFKYRGTGVICPPCKSKQQNLNIKDKMASNELSKIYTIEQEFGVIHKLIELLSDTFEVIKAFDGCNVDMIYRPKECKEDKWVGIQVKSTKRRNPTYSFHVETSYKNCLILLYCCEDDMIWIIPENVITITKIDIGYKKSKYNIYKTDLECISKRLYELYHQTSKHSFDVLDTPSSFYMKREKEFRRYREERIPFLDYVYTGMEGTVYDFTIGKYKVQEKVGRMSTCNTYKFCMSKNNGVKDKKRLFCSYKVSDNDFYWLQSEDKKFFVVIPERILLYKGYIDSDKKKNITISFTDSGTIKNLKWLTDYLFYYESLEKDKSRLVALFS